MPHSAHHQVQLVAITAVSYSEIYSIQLGSSMTERRLLKGYAQAARYCRDFDMSAEWHERYEAALKDYEKKFKAVHADCGIDRGEACTCWKTTLANDCQTAAKTLNAITEERADIERARWEEYVRRYILAYEAKLKYKNSVRR